MSNPTEKNYYYYIVRDKLTHEIRNLKKHDVTLFGGLELMDDLVKKFNDNPNNSVIYHNTNVGDIKQIIDFALGWENTVTLKTIQQNIVELQSGIDDISLELSGYFEEIKND